MRGLHRADSVWLATSAAAGRAIAATGSRRNTIEHLGARLCDAPEDVFDSTLTLRCALLLGAVLGTADPLCDGLTGRGTEETRVVVTTCAEQTTDREVSQLLRGWCLL